MYGLVTFFMRLITTVFFIGLAGSVIVVALSFVEDFHELFSSDDSSSKPPKGANPTPPAI